MEIICNCENCKYNKDGKCEAETVYIDYIECATFVLKMDEKDVEE